MQRPREPASQPLIPSPATLAHHLGPVDRGPKNIHYTGYKRLLYLYLYPDKYKLYVYKYVVLMINPWVLIPQSPLHPLWHLPLLFPTLDATPPIADGRPVPGLPPLIRNMSFSLEPGSRCLLLGANGAGKTTFLKVGTAAHLFLPFFGVGARPTPASTPAPTPAPPASATSTSV
eukprot:364264-Chlamydomonas_euryale.AAC.1